MSLINLSRSTQQANRNINKKVTAEDFIQQAISYANGAIHSENAAQASHSRAKTEAPMRRATFTLTEECIAQLTDLSLQSGIPKSKLIRLWIKHFSQIENV